MVNETPMFRKTKEKGMVRGLTLGCILGIVVSVTGFDPKTANAADEKVSDSDAQDFLRSAPELAKAFQNSGSAPLKPFQIEVLVDESASMEGYVNSAASGPAAARGSKTKATPATPSPAAGSSFFDLLRELANENEVSGYFGFGSDANGATTTFTPHGKQAPLAASQYHRMNNDYADLLDQLAKRPAKAENDREPIERIIITDGVQSHQDKGQGSALGNTVTKLRAWVKQGGVVEMRLFTAPYNGTYYSEELRALNKHYSYPGHVADRPFLVLSLISSKDELPAWKKFWERNAFSGLKQVAYLCYPTPQVTISGLTLSPEERIPKESPVKVMFHNVWDLHKIVTLDGYHDLWQAYVHRIQTADSLTPPTYPSSFVLSGMAPSADLETDLRAMNPVLQVWHPAPPPDPKRGAKPAASGTPAATPAPVDAPKVVWEKIESESVDLRDPNNGHVTRVKLEDPASGFRFTANLTTPAKNDPRVVVIMAKPRGITPPPPDWKAFSILDDSSPTNLNKIYNLQPFVEQLTRDEVSDPAPVAAAVFTHR